MSTDKIHAIIAVNSTETLCGHNTKPNRDIYAYSFRSKYKKGEYCSLCLRAINRWGAVKIMSEADKVKSEGRA